MSIERRLHVRLRPTHELPARVVFRKDALVSEQLQVVDISVGGLALMAQGLPDQMTLRLKLGDEDEHEVPVEVRWRVGDKVGVLFIEASEAATRSIRRYVAELLERG